jgi:hypothetical protein
MSSPAAAESPFKIFHDRLAVTENQRQRKMLEMVIEHGEAEAVPDLERTMRTLVDEPTYGFWVCGRDIGPKDRAGVRAFYSKMFANHNLAVLAYPKLRLTMDDDSIVVEVDAHLKMSGRDALERGYRVPDGSKTYRVRSRDIIWISFDEDARLKGEDVYFVVDPENFEEITE